LLSLEYLVTSLSIFDCGRPHDSVYALVAIARDAAPFPPNSITERTKEALIAEVFSSELEQKPYPLDYNLPYADVCKDFTLFCIQRCADADNHAHEQPVVVGDVQPPVQPVTDATPGDNAAEERAKARPAIVSACDLVPRAEAEAIVGGPLAADPRGNESSCNYAWVAPGTDYQQQMTLAVTWRGGLSEMRTAQAAMGQALNFMATQGLASDQKQQSGTGPFDEEASSMIGVMGVRKDVLLSIETSGTGNDIATAFIAAAAKKF